MAMLDMMYQQGYSIVVAHVNYQLRKEADKETELVQTYCKERHIDCFVKCEPYTYTGNFQSFARIYRYDFCVEILKQEKCQGIICAHHLDDVLETIIMQEKRHFSGYLGIREKSFYKGYPIYRPLLKMRKELLKTYCIQNAILYGEDSSNQSLKYERNNIRHNLLKEMLPIEKETLLEKAAQHNQEYLKMEKTYAYLLKDILDRKSYQKITFKAQKWIVREWLARHGCVGYSKKYIDVLCQLMMDEHNHSISLGDKMLEISYKVCEIVGIKDNGYTYVVQSLTEMHTPHFSLLTKGEHGLFVSDDEWPLTIRNYQPGDVIELAYGKKKISRWFIDHKIDRSLRKNWPVLLNRHQKIIMVPMIGIDKCHTVENANVFMLK